MSALPGGGWRWNRAILAAAMAVVTALAWGYIVRGAGMGMPASDMTVMSLFPHLHEDMEGAMDAGFGVVAGMWFVMMVAMMTPSATPLVLLHARVLRHHGGEAAAAWKSAALLAGYLTAWAGFAVAAAALQRALEPAGLLSGMLLWSRSAWLSAGVLALAGLYQFSALKDACLAQCRAPVQFIVRHQRPGAIGAFRLGLLHGAYCVGCCWLLMALLLVFGIMNLVWIALLSLLVLAEKLLPGRWVPRLSGAALLTWSAATLVAGRMA